ncbi:ABC transporter ATP-binding protein [Balneatrix alpica]|uniref:ABC transporter ATP-binding protein n=1 Tax=Balneatrix alpica TaxID=75684 RepID=A0ABV5ZAF9_9GAMM|nr:sn-glycerol-3-phosphate ABC transporter ATP-binding protein UgpC [Balneatrix alpica]
MADLTLKNLKKSYGAVNILHGIDLDIKDGEFVVLVGQSGCGKSTLLRMIAGLEEISDGELLIDNKRMNELNPAQRGIAMVFQSYALYPHMNVYKNMAFGLKIAGKDKQAIRTKVEEAARILQIDHLLDRLPRELSGGQRQRVAIGRAIVRDPNVFLFDEPLSNLDAALRVQTRVEIGKLHQELNATIIYVTHDQVEAMTLGDKIVVMNNGRVEQVGSPLELYQHPANLFVAGFIGSPNMNFLPGQVVAAEAKQVRVRLDIGLEVSLPVAGTEAKAGDKVTLGIRPEHLQEQPSQGPSLTGKVNLVERLGEASYLYVELPNGQEIIAKTHGESLTMQGDSVILGFTPAQAHLFNDQGQSWRRQEAGELLEKLYARGHAA